MTTEFSHQQLNADSYLDCSHEMTSMQAVPSELRAWLASELKTDDWLIELGENELIEIENAAEFVIKHPIDNMRRSPSDLHLPNLSAQFKRMRNILDNGVGFAVLDRLPVDDYPLEVLVELYWTLGQYIAKPVAQKRNGQMIYDVRNIAKKFEYGVRGSWTNVELNFHTDNAFGKSPPDYVGLFCRHPAMTGGISRFCSFYALHQRLEADHPAALSRLYQPMLYDRQAEHDEGEPKVTLAPFFAWRDGRLRARANPSLVRKGYDVAGIEMEAELANALKAVDEVSTGAEFWYEAALEKGQIQYLNNAEVGHYRSEFEDYPEDDSRMRHLFRLWHRREGSAAYDGGTGVTA